MASLPRELVTDHYYHLFNRGVAKQPIFTSPHDYERFLLTLAYYQQHRPPKRFADSQFRFTDRRPPFRFDIVAYALMPNHYHLVVRQTEDNGISRGIADIQNSFARYFNSKYKRVGSLFQGPFKAIRVETDEQLLCLVRYVLLNSTTARIVDDPFADPWSSAQELNQKPTRLLCEPSIFLDHFTDRLSVNQFLLDYIDYARELASIKHLLADDTD